MLTEPAATAFCSSLFLYALKFFSDLHLARYCPLSLLREFTLLSSMSFSYKCCATYTLSLQDRVSWGSFQQSNQNTKLGHGLRKPCTTSNVFDEIRASISGVNRSKACMFSSFSLPCSRKKMAGVPNRRLLEVCSKMGSTALLRLAYFKFFNAKKEKCFHSCFCSTSKSLTGYWIERKTRGTTVFQHCQMSLC